MQKDKHGDRSKQQLWYLWAEDRSLKTPEEQPAAMLH